MGNRQSCQAGKSGLSASHQSATDVDRRCAVTLAPWMIGHELMVAGIVMLRLRNKEACAALPAGQAARNPAIEILRAFQL